MGQRIGFPYWFIKIITELHGAPHLHHPKRKEKKYKKKNNNNNN
jgi:hypothetical protein